VELVLIGGYGAGTGKL